MNNKVIIGIPSYNPDETLVVHVKNLINIGFNNFIICDDGSKEECQKYFDRVLELETNNIKIDIVKHNINLGYGRASKSIFNFFLGEYKDAIGIVTCDSDGQHIAKDVLRCAQALIENPECYCVGVRDFKKKADIPFRSWIGNNITKNVLRFCCGISLQDTQSGLRAIPTGILPALMETEGERMEFTTAILLKLNDLNVEIKEIPIDTIYMENNSSSHFNPIRDSIRIYSRIVKYCFSSLMSAFIDIFVFSIVVGYYSKFTGKYITAAAITGVIFAGMFNFCFNKAVVFKNNGNIIWQGVKYTCLCLTHAVVSAALIKLISTAVPFNLVAIKIVVDTLLFFVTYFIQGRLVFNVQKNNKME